MIIIIVIDCIILFWNCQLNQSWYYFHCQGFQYIPHLPKGRIKWCPLDLKPWGPRAIGSIHSGDHSGVFAIQARLEHPPFIHVLCPFKPPVTDRKEWILEPAMFEEIGDQRENWENWRQQKSFTKLPSGCFQATKGALSPDLMRGLAEQLPHRLGLWGCQF